ncbi:MAG: V-type ATPase subunit [Nitrospirae bacterium]|nr:V-type ATPase subunit [Nitrospirota bacterium]
MILLCDIEDRGYPTDYLLARIHGRRAFLLKDWEKVLFSLDISGYLMSTRYSKFISGYPADGILRRYQEELQWMYYQMNKNLRHIFGPCFMYAELGTLLTCLRYHLKKGKKTEIEYILAFSLLSERVKNILSLESDLPFILEMLDKRAAFLSDSPAGLSDIFITGGLPEVEQTITRTLLEHIMHEPGHPCITRFFISLIDSINIITLYKHLRWEMSAKPAFITGGKVKETVLSAILHSRDVSEITGLIQKHTGFYVGRPAAANVESALLKGISGQVKKMERESPDIGLILNYLWRFFLEARDLSILYYGNKIDKDIIREELVH